MASPRRRLPFSLLLLTRSKTTSAHYVAARPKDPTFEKHMKSYKDYLKVVSIQDLILSSPSLSLPLPHLSSIAQSLHLHRGARHFVRQFPHVFSFQYDPSISQPILKLTPLASQISLQESDAASLSIPSTVDRLLRLLCMSKARELPLRAVFRVWKELGLPDDFEGSVLRENGDLFLLRDNPKERNTHILQLAASNADFHFTAAVDDWRMRRRSGEVSAKVDEMELRFGFKQGFPPGMKLTKTFRSKLKEWQQLPYTGPYDPCGSRSIKSKAGVKGLEKRAVGIVHEFLSLTVEKMVEVEKISQFRNYFGIDLNIRDLFLDHPGMFYLSTKGKRHTVFLREAYDRGRLIEPNPIYDARRRLLELVLMRRRGVVDGEGKGKGVGLGEEEENEESEDS